MLGLFLDGAVGGDLGGDGFAFAVGKEGDDAAGVFAGDRIRESGAFGVHAEAGAIAGGAFFLDVAATDGEGVTQVLQEFRGDFARFGEVVMGLGRADGGIGTRATNPVDRASVVAEAAEKVLGFFGFVDEEGEGAGAGGGEAAAIFTGQFVALPNFAEFGFDLAEGNVFGRLEGNDRCGGGGHGDYSMIYGGVCVSGCMVGF